MKNLFLSALALRPGHRRNGQARSTCSRLKRHKKTASSPSYDMKGHSHSRISTTCTRSSFASLEADSAEKSHLAARRRKRPLDQWQVFLHVADMNFQMPAAIGATPAPGYKKDGYETSTTDKAKIIAQLNQSFEYVHSSVEQHDRTATSPSPRRSSAPQANAGDIIYIIVADDHEHLGQSVAYARVNGIVPPWTADQIRRSRPAKASRSTRLGP